MQNHGFRPMQNYGFRPMHNHKSRSIRDSDPDPRYALFFGITKLVRKFSWKFNFRKGPCVFFMLQYKKQNNKKLVLQTVKHPYLVAASAL